MTNGDCILCLGREGDEELSREEVWSDRLWRLTTSVGEGDPTPGFSYLEPRRHIPSIADLDGPEAESFGVVMSRSCRALREATGAAFVYVYIFGESVPHLHAHLAPHTEGDALSSDILRGEQEERVLPSGLVAMISKDFPALPPDELKAVAERVRELMS